MFRQSKKIVSVLFALALVMVGVLGTSFTSKAADIYYSTFNRPTENEYSGFINLEIQFNDGTVDVITMAWTIIPTMEGGSLSGETPAVTTMMDISIAKSSITMTGVSNTMDEFFMTIWELNKSGKAVLYSNGYGEYEKSITDSWQGTIIGHTVYGNYGSFYSYLGSYAPNCSVVWADDGIQINKLNSILTSLATLNSSMGGKLDNLISKVTTLISEMDSVEETLAEIQNIVSDYMPMIHAELEGANEKLQSIADKLDSLIVEQQESNSWLEKIFNYLDESEEKQKETATNQGNSSVSDGNSAISDNSAGFIDSVGTLIDKMSYEGTSVEWDFPDVKLPAIPGIMDEVVLIKAQKIDFGWWFNMLPGKVINTVRAICTIALIVFCFKELYGTISYVLTLRGGGNNE